ncbi:unnamed protein product [Rotaria socialis]|uniref:EF-hand domain-containing protein n=1 Tax=Rotaria socialis TaxID=392032 RepID=A0A818J239_9BILA|nr:unnamed protein product [Rotaria socialis]CAF3343997.1 unnamed protein product [Rotaria socialis]CAF3352263.1 unnamed protein product [Rotaria socialis]CAF3364751.1 unnamed protein product [Rotaria socialis]CAF3529277.1 unnamed protein product [Rotaria socialis]
MFNFGRRKKANQNDEVFQEIEKIVHTLDDDGSGRIRIVDLEAALQRFDDTGRLKPEKNNQVKNFITSLKTKGDRIDGDVFLQIMLERQKQIKLSFDEIDLNKDGVVDPMELAKAFSRLKIVLTKKNLMKIVEVLDQDKDFQITFSEWQTYFRFAPSTELEASLRLWRRGVQLDTINEQQLPTSYTEKELESGFYARHFIAGALSGMVSRTVTAPLDRLKIYMQAMGKRKLLKTATTLYGEGGGGVSGVRSFWRGNGIAIFKMTPEMALRQGIFETFRELRGDYDEIIISPVTNKELFGLGCLSGFIAQTCIYPLEVLKTQAAMRTTGQYSSILDLIRKLHQSEGWRVFYRGYLANSLGVLPACGIDFALYEYLRRIYREKCTSLEEPSIWALTAISNVSALAAMYVSYPLYLIRTRQQYQIVPENILEMMGKIWRIDGWRGFYFGSLPNLIKVLPASTVAYLTFEYFSSLFDIDA